MNEVLEMAAQAAGHKVTHHAIGNHAFVMVDGIEWNPMESDADAFRLMVALNIEIEQYEHYAIAYSGAFSSGKIKHADHGCDKSKTTRIAVTTAAAQRGRTMQK